MRFFFVFPVLLLAATVTAAPASKEDDKVVINAEFFPDSLAIYTSQHEIVEILVPLNQLNFDDDDDDDDNEDDKVTLFFIEADVNANGEKAYKGLYVLENRKATKLLDEGRDAAAANDDSKTAYFAAKDGIYTYNANETKAERYGSVDGNFVSIVVENGTDVIYVLTEDHQLYKVTEEGNKKTKIDDVRDAREIVLDYSNNLYYYGADKQPYVINADGVKKIQGLPENPAYVKLLKPAFVIDEGVPFIADKKSYVIYANGTSELTDFELEVHPTAYSMEATLMQYYAYNKKIYEYNVLAIVFGELLEELRNYLTNNKDEIQSIATRSRSSLKL